MSRIVYVNGCYLPYAQAGVHVEDRGYQFADAIYEVIEVREGGLVEEARHLARLVRSLSELNIRAPMSNAALSHVMRETIRRNHIKDGHVYLQVSRGQAPRDFAFPPSDTPRSVVCLARSAVPARIEALAREGIAVKSMPDIRWRRSDIKTVMLLPACLAKDAARGEGAREAWFVDGEGFVTEGGSSNAWIVTPEGKLVTRHLDTGILPGVVRATVIDALAGDGVAFEERPFRLSEALEAHEAFITSSTNTVMPVVRIDGQKIGDGRPGPVTQRIRTKFQQTADISSA